MNQDQKDNLAKMWGISREDQAILDSNHRYGCDCDICLQWWVLMGPDGGELGHYGPFTTQQISTACEAKGLKWPQCHMNFEEY